MSTGVNTNAIRLRREVGAELRSLRIEAGFKRQSDVAERLGVSQARVSQIEVGRKWPTDEQIGPLLDLYGVDDVRRTAIVTKIRMARESARMWWERPEIRDLFPRMSAQIFPLEDAAERILAHSGNYVPGLLQTRAYVQALADFGQKDESIDRRELFVEARLQRQQILSRPNPVTLDVLCLEVALRAAVGGTEVMRDQLNRLVQDSQRNNITIRVVPFSAGAPAVFGTPFAIYDFPGADERSVVQHEKSRHDEVTDDLSELRRARRKFADLAANALDPAATIRLIKQIAKDL
ncbi:helix-turn-helix domain-containing protein [Streptomyces sp. 6N223]|uniref:helix-turn-helix domain-containing protein n=1 Tax=Streptomyces sp. 6N223 TaxID=3457412 RepID=UPI003FD50A2F